MIEAITMSDMLPKVGKKCTTVVVIVVPYICNWAVPRCKTAGLWPKLRGFFDLKVAKVTAFHIFA
jgi:hypothetical protein